MGWQNALATEAYESIKMNADFVESQATSIFSVWRKTFIYLSRPE
jgi:hypothetical protein